MDRITDAIGGHPVSLSSKPSPDGNVRHPRILLVYARLQKAVRPVIAFGVALLLVKYLPIFPTPPDLGAREIALLVLASIVSVVGLFAYATEADSFSHSDRSGLVMLGIGLTTLIFLLLR